MAFESEPFDLFSQLKVKIYVIPSLLWVHANDMNDEIHSWKYFPVALLLIKCFFLCQLMLSKPRSSRWSSRSGCPRWRSQVYVFSSSYTPRNRNYHKVTQHKKSIGPYSIPVFLLKILTRHIAQPLAKIVNLSFETGIFPDKLKVGKVNPLYKKGTCDNPSNYRPISILFVCSQKFLNN